ncbi:MAG TPA: response regulator transcription factor [Vicinamibacterales bacterium]|jgi:DNA-binding NarL/FixJ family response regulator
MIRLFIIDDHPIVHDGVAAILRSEPDIEIAGAASTIGGGITRIGSTTPDVVLLDVRLPDEDGLDGITTILAAHPRVRVIMFTAYDADEYVFAAIKAGAKGYVVKGSPGQELVRAIRQVHAGDSYLSPAIGAKLARQVASPRRGGGLLSPRELAVLRLVAAGQSNQQIAESLGITERTIKFHVTAIFNKLGADNRAQAVAVAAKRGLLG